MRFARASVVLITALAGGIAASQTPDGSTTIRAEDLRIAAVAYRLGRDGSRFCPEHAPVTGLLLHHLPEYGVADRPAAIRLYGLDRGPGVLAVVSGSAAARAGLVAGDVLLAVNGISFPDPKAMAAEPSRKKWRRRVESSEAMLEAELAKGPARLLFLRRQEVRELALTAESGCPVRVRLARSRQRNAFSDGRYVTMTTRLLTFAQSDDELAIIMGHELAHNILRHKQRLELEGVPKGLLSKELGIDADKVRATEEEADRLGLKLAWAAGYDVNLAIPFWRRFQEGELPLTLHLTHPGLRARERLIEETIAELGRESRPGVPEPGR